MRPPNERRTPEAYGRMSQIQQRIVQAQQTPRMPHMQDYEDIYNTQMMQQQQQQLGKIFVLFFVQVNHYETAPNSIQLNQNLTWDCFLISVSLSEFD
mgnify:CR=1 FL=1